MPRIVYGVLEIHRSHRVESPDVARDVEGGRPNACTACHTDRDAAWAADRMRDFWGARYRRPARVPTASPLEVPEALASLHAGDPVQRAVYVAALGRPDSGVPPGARGFALANTLVGLGDAYGAVRFLARRSALRSTGRWTSASAAISPPTTSRPAATSAIRRCRRCCSGSPPPRAGACRRRPGGLFVTPDWQLDLDRIRPLLGLAGQPRDIGGRMTTADADPAIRRRCAPAGCCWRSRCRSA